MLPRPHVHLYSVDSHVFTPMNAAPGGTMMQVRILLRTARRTIFQVPLTLLGQHNTKGGAQADLAFHLDPSPERSQMVVADVEPQTRSHGG